MLGNRGRRRVTDIDVRPAMTFNAYAKVAEFEQLIACYRLQVMRNRRIWNAQEIADRRDLTVHRVLFARLQQELLGRGSKGPLRVPVYQRKGMALETDRRLLCSVERDVEYCKKVWTRGRDVKRINEERDRVAVTPSAPADVGASARSIIDGERVTGFERSFEIDERLLADREKALKRLQSEKVAVSEGMRPPFRCRAVEQVDHSSRDVSIVATKSAARRDGRVSCHLSLSASGVD